MVNPIPSRSQEKEKTNDPPTIQINDDEYTTTISETYNHIINELFPEDNETTDHQIHRVCRIVTGSGGRPSKFVSSLVAEDTTVSSNPDHTIIHEWCNEVKLSINHTKCTAIVFPKGNPLKKGPSIKISGKKIQNSTAVKYLGIILDHRLNWTDHVHHIYEKATKVAQALKTISRNKWGYGPSASRILYTAVVEPIITYGAEIWGSSATRVHIKRKLLSIQRLSAINIAKAYKTAPTEALLVLNNTLPIDLKIREANIRYNLHKLAKGEINLETFSTATCKETYNNEINQIAMHVTTYGLDKHKDLQYIHPSFTSIQSSIHDPIDKHSISIFTDGSKSELGVGCAFTVYKGTQCLYQRCKKLAPHCTINHAESLAILEAITWITNNHNTVNQHNYQIFSDSRVGIHQIAKCNTNLPIIRDTVNSIRALRNRGINIDFHWVKGHSGVADNDRADLLASKAPTLATNISYNRISITHLNNLLHDIILKTWKSRWDNGNTGRLTHRYLPSPSDCPKWNFNTTFQLTQLLTEMVTLILTC
ncbi:uncharacterized protein LOC111638950 [Centruroides sculpturatus]|uniref:uncharacterized protein LOC111638950 n=1 Tax=Centruroides sculpturatus TaxID=218467 RepID=UPI000C6EE0F3|nr:uncharacterized protein LOC111638950 [Centruroides sculpturatus]